LCMGEAGRLGGERKEPCRRRKDVGIRIDSGPWRGWGAIPGGGRKELHGGWKKGEKKKLVFSKS